MITLQLVLNTILIIIIMGFYDYYINETLKNNHAEMMRKLKLIEDKITKLGNDEGEVCSRTQD